MRRTKIVATIGPATDTEEGMRGLIEAGVDVVRLNASHGDNESHIANANLARRVAREAGRTVGVLVDLPGPKMRTGMLTSDSVELACDAEFILTSRDIVGNQHEVSTTSTELPNWVKPHDEIFLADGAIVLRVDTVDGDDVITRVVRAGTLRSRKGMHLPRSESHIDPFTERDQVALELALQIKADFVGLSFVRRPEDVEGVIAKLPKRGHRPSIVAKIETATALDHLPSIVGAADGVMVARGDLGIQVPARRVPMIQKEIIRYCNMAGKPVITATQMLESMTRSPLPTRAEVNDVANAVLDGTDALMLSEETAIGMFASETVRTMAEVAESAENWPHHRVDPTGVTMDGDLVAWAVAHAAVQAAEDLGVAAILCPTKSGSTARRVAAWRPSMPIAGISPNPNVLGGLALTWGVKPLEVPEVSDGNDQLRVAVRATLAAGLASPGDLVAVVFGSVGPRAGSTDSVRIIRA